MTVGLFNAFSYIFLKNSAGAAYISYEMGQSVSGWNIISCDVFFFFLVFSFWRLNAEI